MRCIGAMIGCMGLLGGLHAQCPSDGQVTFHDVQYAVTAIGGQCWLAENLSTTKYADGSSILVVDKQQWAELSAAMPLTGVVMRKGVPAGAGRIYNAAAVLHPSGLCPSGWHVPTDSDWRVLEMALGLAPTQAQATGFRGLHGAQLRGEDPKFEEWTGLNSLNFCALPGGFRTCDGQDFNWGDSGFWWSQTRWHGGEGLWMRSLSNSHEGMYRSIRPEAEGLSVRCLRD